MVRPRETWIDAVKMVACVLVAVGHFFQSMVSAELISANPGLAWFNNTIYYFHVPLFFICSGYLFQKSGNVRSVSSWASHILKKSITLGIPYLVFSVGTWILKNVFSSSVNIQNEGLLETLFLKPISPYWYLYALFFVFLVTPTMTSPKMAAVGLGTAFILKLIRIYSGGTDIYAVSTVMDNGIWFVFGMVLHMFRFPEVCCSGKWKRIAALTTVLFLAGSAMACVFPGSGQGVSLLMGVLGCVSTMLISVNAVGRDRDHPAITLLSRYTMPIFLMHTIFAAGVRVVIMKMGIFDPVVHIVLGLLISFAGPMAAAEIMRKFKLDILFDPGRYIRLFSNRGNEYV